jgi:hypothetical protein
MTMRELTNVEKSVFGVDAVIGDDGVPISQSSLKLGADVNHQAAIERAKAKAASGAVPSEAVMKEMLALVKDSQTDKAMAARVEKLKAAADDARTARGDADKASKALDEKRLEHLRLLAAERDAQDRALAAERAALESERASKLADLVEREGVVAKREAELKAASAELKERLADVDKRLGLIRQAAR